MYRKPSLASTTILISSLWLGVSTASAQTTQAAATSMIDKQPINYHWHSGDSGYRRLLFEEPRLERDGISRLPPVQLAQSSSAFFSRSLLLPFNFLLGRHRQEQVPVAP